MASLPDVNLMVALLHPQHEHTPIALRWLDRQTEARSILVCRVVQMGVLRTLTRPSVMRESVKTPTEFWMGYEAAMEDERFGFVTEPEGLEQE